jgi:hypothetical protein
MSNRFASGKKAISECDRCGQRYKLKQLRELVIRTKNVNILVCPECWDPDHPQLMQGMYPVEDPQALRRPRPDLSLVPTSIGSRDIQWGWDPVGFNNVLMLPIQDNLLATGQVGTVTVTTT